ncbi:MAG: ATP-dependent metalloprotease, partial [Pseudomonadota bacterium]|nr:ATP-dependent metalloprotease [Pseudomonadota bacterium]
EHLNILHVMAKALIKYETLDSEQIDDIMAGKTPKPPKDWEDPDEDGFSKNTNGKEIPDIKTKNGKIGGPASSH